MEENNKVTNIKEKMKRVKEVIIDGIKNPLDKIKEVANESSAKFLKIAIILLILWVVIVFVGSFYDTIYYWGFARIFKNIFKVLKTILAPVIGILIFSIIVVLLNKSNKKSLLTIITTLTFTKIPLIIASLVSLLTLISSKIGDIVQPFCDLCLIISIVLEYFGLKNLFKEESDKVFFKKYILIQSIYIVVSLLAMLLKIYI